MPRRTHAKGFRAWLVRWSLREDKVAKNTGTVITLLPSRFSTDMVKRITEALYSAYVLPYDALKHYARRRQPRAEAEFDLRVVTINENPGLPAVLATDIKIQCDGMRQTISWREPDSFALQSGSLQKIAEGAQHRVEFDFGCRVQSSDSTLPL